MMNRSQGFSIALFFSLLCAVSINASAQSPDRAQLEKEMSSLRERMKEVENQFLAPAREDSEAFAEFLQQPGTGLVRLLPREKFDGLLSTRGGGAYYSFTRLTHEYGYGSDLELQHGELGVGFAGADFGMLIMLGDVNLNEVTPELPAVEYLTFSTPMKEAEARAQHRQAGMGFEVNGFIYKSRLPVRVNKTYALRSINYDQGDVLVAFRVVRQDADGSIVIVWKLLKKFAVPRLERTETANAAGS